MQAIEAETQASRWGRGHPTPSLNRLLCFETGDVPPRRPLDDSEPVLVRQVPGSAHQFCWVASPLGRETSPARCQPANRARSAGNLSWRASNSAPSPSGRGTISSGAAPAICSACCRYCRTPRRRATGDTVSAASTPHHHQTEKDAHPLPRIIDMLHQQG